MLPFIDRYGGLIGARNATRPIRVALIDNGVLNISPHDAKELNDPRGLWRRIKEGRTFVVPDCKASPWLFASDPHGTQMANLICAIDPNCELYVAKVGEGQYGIFASRVCKVNSPANPPNTPPIFPGPGFLQSDHLS